MNLLAQAAETANGINPEAMIAAAIAAKSAESAAWYASIMAAITLVVLLGIGLMMMFVWLKFDKLERNTDGMREALVVATRKLALIEGNITGRAEQLQEQAGQKNEGKKES